MRISAGGLFHLLLRFSMALLSLVLRFSHGTLRLFGDNRQLFDELLVWSTRKSSRDDLSLSAPKIAVLINPFVYKPHRDFSSSTTAIGTPCA
jgi:hypothetical protein